jgi:hypothetical protein
MTSASAGTAARAAPLVLVRSATGSDVGDCVPLGNKAA